MQRHIFVAYITILFALIYHSGAWANGQSPFPNKLPNEHAVGFDERKAEAYARRIDGWSTLTLAVLKGEKALAEACLKQGADINAKDNFGRSPLLLATEYNCGEMVAWLLDRGADVNTTGKDNRTPLMAALAQGNLKRAELLRSRGAQGAFNSPQGGTPLNLAQLSHRLRAQDPAEALKGLRKKAAVESTKVIFTSAAFSTASLHSAAKPVSILRYRIEADSTVSEWATAYARKEGSTEPVYDYEYFLVFQGCPQRIRLDQTQYSRCWFIPESVELKWLERGRLVDVKWVSKFSGTAGAAVEYHLVLQISGHKIQRLLFEEQSLHARNGSMSAEAGDMRLEWKSKTRELVVTHYDQSGDWLTNRCLLCDVIPAGYGRYLDFKYLKSVYHYRLEGTALRYIKGERFVLGVNGRPSLDVAQKYGVELAKLKALNPSLRGKIFCDRAVLLDDQLEEPREEKYY